jgi:polar amino acid transport system permease protein
MIRDLNVNDFIYILTAAQWTLLLSAFAVVGGGLVAIAIVLMRLGRIRALSWVTVAYIQFFQATPPLMQLFLIFFGGTLVGVRLEAWTAALIAFSLYSSAYLADIWHGSIQSVPRHQWEGARALSFSEPLMLVLIIVPQALRISVPPTIGFLVQVIKTTSLASIIGFIELVRAGQFINNSTLQPLPVYGFVACIYFAICWPLSKWGAFLEARLGRSAKRA